MFFFFNAYFVSERKFEKKTIYSSLNWMQFRIKLCLRFRLFPFFEKQCTFKLSSHLFPDKKEVKATGK